MDNARALPTTPPAQHQHAMQIHVLSSSRKEVRPREHSTEAIVGASGAFQGEAIRILTLIVALHILIPDLVAVGVNRIGVHCSGDVACREAGLIVQGGQNPGLNLDHLYI